MASVHVGRLDGPGGFKRTVAIKRLHPTYSEDAEFVAMLRDEGSITGRIRHPNVVPVLDVVAADRELLLVMEYVHGESLAKLIDASQDGGHLPPLRFVAQIMANVLSGLHAAHACAGDGGVPLDVVHRDVSPQNVIVGVDGIARILDFGIARAAERSRGTTRDGTLRGKIAYMAPEQVSEEPVDRRADIYAAAVVFWEAVTGKPLYDGPVPVIVAEKLGGIPERASLHVPGLAPAIDAIIAKGLESDPKKRWATAEDMARAIEAAIAPVAPREIGEWVTSVAGAELERRARTVARVEAADDAGAAVRGADTATVVETRSERRGRPHLWLLGAAAAALVLLALAASRVSWREQPPSEQDAAVLALPSPPPASPSVSALTSSEPASPSMTATAPPRVAVPATKKKATRHPKTACDPPFRVDERGVRILKKECF